MHQRYVHDGESEGVVAHGAKVAGRRGPRVLIGDVEEEFEDEFLDEMDEGERGGATTPGPGAVGGGTGSGGVVGVNVRADGKLAGVYKNVSPSPLPPVFLVFSTRLLTFYASTILSN